MRAVAIAVVCLVLGAASTAHAARVLTEKDLLLAGKRRQALERLAKYLEAEEGLSDEQRPLDAAAERRQLKQFITTIIAEYETVYDDPGFLDGLKRGESDTVEYDFSVDATVQAFGRYVMGSYSAGYYGYYGGYTNGYGYVYGSYGYAPGYGWELEKDFSHLYKAVDDKEVALNKFLTPGALADLAESIRNDKPIVGPYP